MSICKNYDSGKVSVITFYTVPFNKVILDFEFQSLRSCVVGSIRTSENQLWSETFVLYETPSVKR